ncbi:hypothetical protein DFH08DRAFT_953318 [Mycena albidolilacea]|uniref:Uncharacterized protein n=1 Tax=Mycena albidolilacea TaxID=1033008 RepID=A0AAD7AGJ2_9AGAR|nr:hypothetical protein DFH08DRAFT_953318 [Mycena albidolilacea]
MVGDTSSNFLRTHDRFRLTVSALPLSVVVAAVVETEYACPLPVNEIKITWTTLDLIFPIDHPVSTPPPGVNTFVETIF